MNLKFRSYQKELLDRDDIPFNDILENMKELNFINTWLGGHAITINGFKFFLAAHKKITVCEMGCGGGDNLAAIAGYCKQNNISIHCIGIDIKKECIDVAVHQKNLQQITEWKIADYRLVEFEEKPDIIFSALFCHHFTEEELILQLQWMQQNSRLGFFINDLQRQAVAFYSIKILTQLFSSSYLVKNDAPLSVARGFIKNDWKNIMQEAGISNYTIRWQWAFRYLIAYRHAG